MKNIYYPNESGNMLYLGDTLVNMLDVVSFHTEIINTINIENVAYIDKKGVATCSYIN